MKTLEDILARHPFWNEVPPQYLPLLIECASISVRARRADFQERL